MKSYQVESGEYVISTAGRNLVLSARELENPPKSPFNKGGGFKAMLLMSMAFISIVKFGVFRLVRVGAFWANNKREKQRWARLRRDLNRGRKETLEKASC